MDPDPIKPDPDSGDPKSLDPTGSGSATLITSIEITRSDKNKMLSNCRDIRRLLTMLINDALTCNG